MKTKTKFVLYLTIFSLVLTPLAPVGAAFNPSHIISDYEFRDFNSMTMDDIWRFLKGKGSTLTNYVDPFIRVGAAQLIYDHARLSQINPKVLLVKLQKEQSLVTDKSPEQKQYDWATGYGICDSCSKSDPALQKYKGFANQIDFAASALRLFYDNPDKYGYPVGSVQIIDGQAVTVANAATHALYIYTPHIHGNQNFYNIWQDWFSQSYPDGSLLQDANTGGIFLIQHGSKRPFADSLAFASRYSFDKVIRTSPEVLEAYTLGPPIKFAQYSLLQDKTTGGIYLIVDDVKRPITSKEAFRQIGFNPEEVTAVSPEELAEVATGQPITVNDAYPAGQLLQDKTTGGIWFVKDGLKQAIWHRTLMDANFARQKAQQVLPQELEKYGTSEPIKFKDGELVRSFDNPTVYVISNEMKRPIASGEAFEKLGYKWENVIMTSEKALSLHLEGEPLDVSFD